MSMMSERIKGVVDGESAGVRPMEGGATFSLSHRIRRLIWSLAWLVLAAWTPSFFWRWRGMVLRLFGAKIHHTAIVRASARIWWPGHLTMAEHASLGPGAICYNVAPVILGAYAIVSQRAHLCTAGHDVDDADFPLVARPITIGARAWVAAEAFVGPGVELGEGAVLGARGVAFKSLDAWTIHGGNPARLLRSRRSADAAG